MAVEPRRREDAFSQNVDCVQRSTLAGHWRSTAPSIEGGVLPQGAASLITKVLQ